MVDRLQVATPSPGLRRPVKTPGAGHPLPQGGEGWVNLSITLLSAKGACVTTRFTCHSEEFPWAFGPPEGMKVERKSPAMENGAICMKKSKLSIFSPPDFQESRRGRGILQCVENTQSEIPRSARNDSLGAFFRSL